MVGRAPQGTLKPAIFFDRDGTLNIDHHYTFKVADLELIQGAAEAVRSFQAAGYHTVIVTNQSGIARGYFSEIDLEQFNTALIEQLRAMGAEIDLVLHCPHHPDITGPCSCRKPKPGLIHEACKSLPIDLSRSLLIGDKPSDVQCATAAGIDGHLFVGNDLNEFCRSLDI